jgi:predicted O-methyltransferase YrrM
VKFSDIHKIVRDVPYIDHDNARELYDLILREERSNILELGIAHGTATCYMAAALDELGSGLVTAVDLVEAADVFRPSVEEQLARSGLGEYVRVVRETTGYNWFLHDAIRAATREHHCEATVDLCIIDGPKNWTIDGCAFFLVDKLLVDGAWLIFDDYCWKYQDASEERESTDGITHRSLSEAERATPHVKEIFELLVMQHPGYSDFVVHDRGDWAWARKRPSEDKTFTVSHRHTHRSAILGLLHRVRNWLGGSPPGGVS